MSDPGSQSVLGNMGMAVLIQGRSPYWGIRGWLSWSRVTVRIGEYGDGCPNPGSQSVLGNMGMVVLIQGHSPCWGIWGWLSWSWVIVRVGEYGDGCPDPAGSSRSSAVHISLPVVPLLACFAQTPSPSTTPVTACLDLLPGTGTPLFSFGDVLCSL